MTASQLQSQSQTPDQLKTLVGRLAAQYGVDSDKFYKTLAGSVFAQNQRDRNGAVQAKSPTPEEMMALLAICERYQLDPFTRQIYAFSNRGKIVPIVSIDGWLSIINRQPDYDGLEVEESERMVEIGGVKVPEFCRVRIFRKSLSRPITISEYASEVFVNANDVWKKFPRRMLRHKAIIQAARVAFSISGIYDRDDAESIVRNESDVIDVPSFETGGERSRPAQRTHRGVSFRTKEELDGALESAIRTAQVRGDRRIAEDWVNRTLEGTQREYGLAYLEDRRVRAEAAEQAALPKSPAAEPAERPAEKTPEAPSEQEVPPMPPASNFEDMPY